MICYVCFAFVLLMSCINAILGKVVSSVDFVLLDDLIHIRLYWDLVFHVRYSS